MRPGQAQGRQGSQGRREVQVPTTDVGVPSVSSSTASGCTWEESPGRKTLPLDLTAMKYVSHRLRWPGGLLGTKRLGEAPPEDHPRCPTLPDSPHLLMVDLCSKMLPDLVMYVTLLGLNLPCRVTLPCLTCRDEGKGGWAEQGAKIKEETMAWCPPPRGSTWMRLG